MTIGRQCNSKIVNSTFITLNSICVGGNKTHCHHTVFKQTPPSLAQKEKYNFSTRKKNIYKNNT